MVRFALILALMLFAAPALAQCPNGRCNKPIRSTIAAIPTLAAPARPTFHAPMRGRERSVVVFRGYHRPLFAGIGPRGWQSARYRR